MSYVKTFFRHPAIFFLVSLFAIAAAGVAVSSGQSRLQKLEVARVLTQGNPDTAPQIMRRYGCVGCHTIPGVPGADGQVGGPLAGLRKRVFIGGVVNNTGDNLIRWIVSPQSFSEHTAMPATGISETEARDVAAYLYAH